MYYFDLSIIIYDPAYKYELHWGFVEIFIKISTGGRFLNRGEADKVRKLRSKTGTKIPERLTHRKLLTGQRKTLQKNVLS